MPGDCQGYLKRGVRNCAIRDELALPILLEFLKVERFRRRFVLLSGTRYVYHCDIPFLPRDGRF